MVLNRLALGQINRVLADVRREVGDALEIPAHEEQFQRRRDGCRILENVRYHDALQRMIQEGNVTALELGDLLITLESQGLITASEHAALHELAANAKLEELTPQ